MASKHQRLLRRCLESVLDNIERAIRDEVLDAELANALYHIEAAHNAVSAHFDRLSIQPGTAKQELKQ